MNQDDIETLAVSAVRDSIVRCELLGQSITEKDKEPSWDGFVYVYFDKGKTKDKLNGRLSVQVKGTVNDDFSKEEISFPISIIDLNNYLHNSGIIFFVVYIDSTGFKKQIYYVELPPIKIRVLLKEAAGQKSKNVKLKRFPDDDSNKKTMIFINCLDNCRRQASFDNAKLFSLEELMAKGVFEGVTIPVSTVKGIDPKTAILTNEVYIYANIKGSSIPQPIEFIPDKLTSTEKRKVEVKVGERLFYTSINLIRDANTAKILIGSSFSITTDIKNQSVKIDYRNSDSLRSLVVDLDFILSYLEHKSFTFGHNEFYYDEQNADLSNFDIGIEKERLKYFKKIVQVLDLLNCKKDISISSLKQNDWYTINLLIQTLIEHKPINGIGRELPCINTLNIGSLFFIVYFKKINDNPELYEIFDFFNTDLLVCYNSDKEQNLPISQFYILHTDDLLKAENIRFDILLPSFKRLERHSELMSKANDFMLKLIKAYDKAPERKEFLQTADAFADWIISADDNEVLYGIRLLNKLQIEKRKGFLSNKQKKELYKLIETKDVSEDLLVGAYLILDQQAAAEIHFEKLTQQQQIDFKKYPIYHFWNNIGEK